MTEQSREERRTAKLRRILPLYDYIELSVDSLEGPARCSVPLSRSNSNHVGIMHAGVIFSLAEATAGVAVSLHRDLASYAVIAKNVAIRYRRPVTTRLHAAAALSAPEAAAIRDKIETDLNHAFDVMVSLHDAQDDLVAECICTFVLRAVPPATEARFSTRNMADQQQ